MAYPDLASDAVCPGEDLASDAVCPGEDLVSAPVYLDEARVSAGACLDPASDADEGLALAYRAVDLAWVLDPVCQGEDLVLAPVLAPASAQVLVLGLADRDGLDDPDVVAGVASHEVYLAFYPLQDQACRSGASDSGGPDLLCEVSPQQRCPYCPYNEAD